MSVISSRTITSGNTINGPPKATSIGSGSLDYGRGNVCASEVLSNLGSLEPRSLSPSWGTLCEDSGKAWNDPSLMDKA